MSKQKRTYKEKFYLICIAFVALMILSYFLAISKTLSEREKFSLLTQKHKQVQNLSSELKKWSNLSQQLDVSLGGQEFYLDFHEGLLSSVGTFCHENQIQLVEFSEPFEGIDESYSVETIVLKFQGKYHPLLKLVHHLEETFKGGKISSASFTKEKNFKKNREELFLELYIQNIKLISDESN